MNTEGTICVVDDDEAMRHSLQWLLESAGWRVQTFASAEAFLKRADPNRVDCLLLDVRMPGMSGLELQAYLAREKIGPPVILITGHGDIPMAVQAMRAGAYHFIEKPFDDGVLVETIRQALQVRERSRAQRARREAIVLRLAELTPREHQVMERVVAGWSNKRIAAEFGVSIKTIEAHRARVMEKMEAGSLAELVRMVLAAE